MRKTTSSFIEALVKTELTWVASRKEFAMFDAIFLGEHVQLRINDFPDEVPCTIFLRNEEMDLEEFPKMWHLQH